MEIKQFLVFHLIFVHQNQILDLENLSKLFWRQRQCERSRDKEVISKF